MRTMGVTCDNVTIYVAALEDGLVMHELPERIQFPEGLEQEARLGAVYDDVVRVLDEIAPDRIVILRPEATYSASHSQFTPRITLETLLRLAASKKGVPLDRMSRQHLRAALDLPKRGKLDNHLGLVFEGPSGGYWKQGRGLAAMAARALEKT